MTFFCVADPRGQLVACDRELGSREGRQHRGVGEIGGHSRDVVEEGAPTVMSANFGSVRVCTATGSFHVQDVLQGVRERQLAFGAAAGESGPR